MMKKAMLTVTLVIMSLYLFLGVVSIDGFSPHGVINGLIDSLAKISHYVVLLMLVVPIFVVNFFILIWLVKHYGARSVLYIFLSSFFIGLVLFFATSKINVISKSIYDYYIFYVYDGMYYEGEDKVQQSMSFIVRYLTLCFMVGGGLSFISRKIVGYEK